jgi:hypothetical protein
MAATQYPEFVKGQTLTSDELNELATHLIGRDRQVGRMTGFGIGCGLTGTISGTQLTITSGLAVDQRGEPLVLPAAAAIDLAAPPASGRAYPFIAAGPGGFSVILRGTDDRVVAPPCSQADCAGHSATHTVGAALDVAPGRVTGPWFSFPDEPLLQVAPLMLSATSQPLGAVDFATLRAAVSKALTNSGGTPLVAADLLALLDLVSLPSSDLPGVKAYKVAWLNAVLFATLDLLRVRALLAAPCLQDASEPGVVLGYLTLAGGTWTFDSAYRHDWLPLAGLSAAILGGRHGDLSGVARERLEELISGYAPPTPPAAPPDHPGDGVVLPGKIKICPNGKCKLFPYPKPKPPRPWDPIEISRVDLTATFNPTLFADQAEGFYGVESLTYLQDDVLDGSGLIGQLGKDAEATLKDTISSLHIAPNVILVNAAALSTTPAYEATLQFTPSDQAVVTVDDAGVVVGLGRVPAITSARQVGTAIPAAVAAAAQVVTLAATVDEQVKSFNVSLGDVSQTVRGLGDEVVALRGGTFDVTGYGLRIATLENQAAKAAVNGERIATLEGRVGIKGVLTASPALTPEVARGLTEFTRSAVAAIRMIDQPANENLPGYIADAERAQGELETAVAAEGQPGIGPATLALLDTVRTMVKAAGADARLAGQLDAQFGELRGMLG